MKFFDGMLAELESSRCVDTSRIFSAGYSGGAWLTNMLECARGDKLRATDRQDRLAMAAFGAYSSLSEEIATIRVTLRAPRAMSQAWRAIVSSGRY